MRRQEARIEDNDDLKIKPTSPNIPALKSAVGSNAFNLVEQMQYLYVRIIRARDLFDSNKNSSTSFESYAEVRVGNYKGMSSSKKTPNPEWNQVFAFSKDRIHSSYMEIILRTDNKNNNSSCEETCSFKGGLVYDMNDVPTRVPPDSPLAPQWCKLRGESVRGDLMLAVWMGTQADEAFPEAWHSDCIGVSVEGVMNTRSKVYLSPRLWYLRVNVIQVQDLNLNLQEKNKREVFIRAIVGNTVLKSSRSWNLSWNEDLLFVVAEPFEHMLVLSVEDKNGGTVLGKCNIHLHSLERRVVNKPVAARWYCLENPGKVVNGKIHLRISLDGGYHVLDESTHFSSDLRPTVKQLRKSCIGVLELGILNARGLPATKKTTDAYCVAKYGQKWVRTRTIIDCTTPQWNEQYTWEVFDPCTVITVAVFDNSNLNGNGTQTDARIGKIKIRLSTLETNRIYTNSYPLIVLHPQGVKRMGEIQLAVRFTCSSFFTLLQTYCEPILPAMHYLHPLSVYQLHYLRYQASHILAIRLSRSEPSLRKEVVEYMLDMGSTSASASASGWSSRICKANYQRCRDQIALLLHFFNFICSWEKPVVTREL